MRHVLPPAFVLRAIPLAVLLAALTPAIIFGQNLKTSLVPKPVQAALTRQYPGSAKPTWEKEKGNFEANWGGKSGEDTSVKFTPAGVFVEEVVAIPLSMLPAAVGQYVKTNYPGRKISEAGRVKNADGSRTFEAEIKGKDLIFDETGKFLKTD